MRLSMISTIAMGMALSVSIGLTTHSALARPVKVPAKPAQKEPTAKEAKPLADSLSGMAKAEYEAGRVLYGDKDYAAAMVKFQKAYELSNDPRLLWNVAVCLKNLRHYARMLKILDQLQADDSPLLTEKDKKAATDLANAAKDFVSPMKLTVNVPGATIRVDDDKIGTTPIDDLIMLDVGSRRIRISKKGYKEYDHTEQVTGGEELELSVKLEKEVHRGTLVISAGDKDLISLDGKMIGQGRWQGAVNSGGHTLLVTRRGMDPYQTEVLVQEDQRREIQVTLKPQSSGIPTWVWLASGAVLAAGAIVGGVFLFQPGPEEVGTIQPGTVQLSFGGVKR